MFDRERRVAALERRGPRPWTDGPRLIRAESDALAVEGNATYRTRAAMCQVVQEWRTAVAAFCDVRIIRDVPFRVTDARSLGASAHDAAPTSSHGDGRPCDPALSNGLGSAAVAGGGAAGVLDDGGGCLLQ